MSRGAGEAEGEASPLSVNWVRSRLPIYVATSQRAPFAGSIPAGY